MAARARTDRGLLRCEIRFFVDLRPCGVVTPRAAVPLYAIGAPEFPGVGVIKLLSERVPSRIIAGPPEDFGRGLFQVNK